MKLLCILILTLTTIAPTAAQLYSGPVAKPSSGYGVDGIYSIDIQSFTNPNYPAENIRIYYPSGITSSVPSIFYSHGYGGENPLHVIGLLSFIARKGYAVVFVPYQTNGVSINDRYQNLLEGFRKAARDYPAIIDTSQVGFIGHSFGGGASIGTAYKCFTENNWGQNGRFLFTTAPWYSFNITQSELQSFPSDTKMLTMIFENDSVNDHRMAVEIFSQVNIPSAEKDFITVQPSTVSGYNYTAGHDLPATHAAFDALDYHAYYRLIDALCDYTFNGNLAGKDVALGNGSTNQVSMPQGMNNLLQSDHPAAAFPESIYEHPCSFAGNPRKVYCEYSTASVEFHGLKPRVTAYPNPAKDLIFLETEKPLSRVEIYNHHGQLVMSSNYSAVASDRLAAGLYLLKVFMADDSIAIVKVMVE